MEVGAAILREALVGGVADDLVPEAVHLLAERGRSFGANEVAPNEIGETGPELLLAGRCRAARLASSPGIDGERDERRPAEDLADDRRVLQGCPIGWGQAVEAGGDQGGDRGRHVGA